MYYVPPNFQLCKQRLFIKWYIKSFLVFGFFFLMRVRCGKGGVRIKPYLNSHHLALQLMYCLFRSRLWQLYSISEAYLQAIIRIQRLP